MMGWGVAAVLLVERGLSWWQVALIVVGGITAEFVGIAFVDGIKRGREQSALAVSPSGQTERRAG